MKKMKKKPGIDPDCMMTTSICGTIAADNCSSVIECLVVVLAALAGVSFGRHDGKIDALSQASCSSQSITQSILIRH